jgi:hypothetical protein
MYFNFRTHFYCESTDQQVWLLFLFLSANNWSAMGAEDMNGRPCSVRQTHCNKIVSLLVSAT